MAFGKCNPLMISSTSLISTGNNSTRAPPSRISVRISSGKRKRGRERPPRPGDGRRRKLPERKVMRDGGQVCGICYVVPRILTPQSPTNPTLPLPPLILPRLTSSTILLLLPPPPPSPSPPPPPMRPPRIERTSLVPSMVLESGEGCPSGATLQQNPIPPPNLERYPMVPPIHRSEA